MKVARLYTRRIMATRRSAPIAEAAAAMQRFQVGTLLVMEDGPSAVLPIGIVTDRDLALKGFASESSTVGSVMTPVLATIDDVVDGLSTDLAAAAAVLKGEVRRDAAGLGDVKVGG